jgi:hypothetical protein
MKRSLIAFVLAIALVAGAPAQARKTVLSPNKMSAIASPVDKRDSRLLIHFELPKEILDERAIVDFATLHIKAQVSDAAMAQIDVFAVATDWQSTGSVSWDRPWTKAGGDIVAEAEPSIYSLRSESGLKEMTIDVTEIVRSWKAGKLANNGILMTISKDDLVIDRPSVAFNLDDIAMRVFYSIEYK